MDDTLASIGGLLALAAGAIALGYVLRRRGNRDRRALERQSEAALEGSLPSGIATHLDDPIAVEDVAVVREGDGEPAYVPIVRVPLGTTEAPGSDLLFDYVANVLEAVGPVFRDERVTHYDVQFTFGPGGLLVSGECRRVSVPPEMVDRLLEERSYRAHDLRRDIERGDDGDGTPPVSWGDCRSYG